MQQKGQAAIRDLGAVAAQAKDAKFKDFIAPRVVALAEEHGVQLKAMDAEVAVVLEPEWAGKVSDVQTRLRKALETAKSSTARVEKQIADAEELQ